MLIATSKSKKRNKLSVKTSRFGETEITKFASTSFMVLGVCQKLSLFLTDCRSTYEGYKMYGFIWNSPYFKIFIVLFLPNLWRTYPGLKKNKHHFNILLFPPLKHLIVSIENMEPEHLPRFFIASVTSTISFFRIDWSSCSIIFVSYHTYRHLKLKRLAANPLTRCRSFSHIDVYIKGLYFSINKKKQRRNRNGGGRK